MSEYKLSYCDTCLSDYFGGHHLPVLQVPVYNGMTYRELRESLVDEYNQGFELYPDVENIEKLVNDLLAPVWNGAIPGISMDSNAFEELETTQEDEAEFMDSVYFYVVFEDVD